MKKLILSLAFVAMSTPAFAGYRLVIATGPGNYAKAITQIDFDYQNKDACEKASIPAQSVGWETVCIPTDTHVANLESD